MKKIVFYILMLFPVILVANDKVTSNGAPARNLIIDRIEFNKEPSLSLDNSIFNNFVLNPNPV